MKTLSVCLGVAVLFLLVAFFNEHRRTTELQSSIAAFGKDRDAVNGELRKLSSEIAELRNRPVVTPAASAIRSETSTVAAQPAVATPAPIVPVERPGVTIKAPEGWWRN